MRSRALRHDDEDAALRVELLVLQERVEIDDVARVVAVGEERDRAVADVEARRAADHVRRLAAAVRAHEGGDLDARRVAVARRVVDEVGAQVDGEDQHQGGGSQRRGDDRPVRGAASAARRAARRAACSSASATISTANGTRPLMRG